MRSHLFTYFVWQTVMQTESILAHSGYNLPFVPIVDGREHAFHHSHIQANYGSWFLIFDKLFGTDQPFKLWLKKKELKAQKQSEIEHKTSPTGSGSFGEAASSSSHIE